MSDVICRDRRAFLNTSLALSGAAAVGALVGGLQAAYAQSSAVKQPAVIGYPNNKGVTIERVTYPARNMGTTIAANLFKPAKFDTGRKYPAVVVTHPFGGVKEQTAGLYAQHLAEQDPSRLPTRSSGRAAASRA
jgi:dipeptidyl aminopeptidase/acylaminoacyl peptidase